MGHRILYAVIGVLMLFCSHCDASDSKFNPIFRFNSEVPHKSITSDIAYIEIIISWGDNENQRLETAINLSTDNKQQGFVNFKLANIPKNRLLKIEAKALKNDATVIKTIRSLINPLDENTDTIIDELSSLQVDISERVAQRLAKTIWNLDTEALTLVKIKTKEASIDNLKTEIQIEKVVNEILSILTNDNSPPEFIDSYPKPSSLSENSLNVLVNCNEYGNVYYVLLDSNALQPTALQVKNGQDASGNDVTSSKRGVLEVVPNIPIALTINNLLVIKNYRIHIAIEDIVGNLQSKVYPISSNMFTETTDVLTNPYMGWVPSAKGGPYPQPHTMVFINETWKNLQPTKDSIDFEGFETRNKLSYWRAKGMKAVLRINMDYPSEKEHRDIPDWLYEETADGIDYNIGYGKGYSPNYDNEKLIAYHEILVKKLAERYNDDSLITLIQLGSLGHWGEFHTYSSKQLDIPFPKIAVVNQYIQHYINNFSKKMLLVRRPLQIAVDNNFGYYNDSIGNGSQTYEWGLDFLTNGYHDYHTAEDHPSMPNWWAYVPTGGELVPSPCTPNFYDDRITTTIQMIKDLRISWLGPNCPIMEPLNSPYQNNIDSLLKTMGYRFMIESVSYPDTINSGDLLAITILWNNKGVAPFYFPWPMEISLTDDNGNIICFNRLSEDIRTVATGRKSINCELLIPKGIPSGKYKLCVAIINPETNKPGVNLAIDGKQPNGSYQIGLVEIN